MPTIFRKIQLRQPGAFMVLWYGVGLAVMIFLLKVIEYKFFIGDFSLEVYLGGIAVMFTGIGLWAGTQLVKLNKSEQKGDGFLPDEQQLKQLGISQREFEVLELIARGLSNKEIADRLYIALPTVKTHSSNLFLKLDVQRRTQAVIKARELKIIG